MSRYAAAVESGSLASLKQVYPGMTRSSSRDGNSSLASFAT